MSNEKVARARQSLNDTANENGGVYQEPAPYRGSCARTMFDRPASKDGTVAALVPEVQIGDLRRESYVRISSVHPRTLTVEAEYIGVVASGPFAEPDALSATAPTLVTAAAHGAVLTPKFHGVADIDVFSERVSGSLIPPVRRPYPNSPVFLLEAEAVKEILGLDVPPEDKPFRIGLLDGTYDLPVAVPASRKSVLFKHVAILGTTGGGKSTTVSGLLAKLSSAGNAVVVFDVEGEYSTIDKGADNAAMLAALAKRGLAPSGVKDSKLFVLAGRQESNPKHPSINRFKIPFDQLSPFVLAELLELSEPQARRFFDAYDACRVLMERLKIYPASQDEQSTAADIDELERGWPRMTVRMLLDVVSAAISLIDDTMDEYRAFSPQFSGKKDEIKQVIAAKKFEKDVRSWKAIAKRLWRMLKAGVFGDDAKSLIDITELVKPGQVSIIDLSDMDAPYLRNKWRFMRSSRWAAPENHTWSAASHASSTRAAKASILASAASRSAFSVAKSAIILALSLLGVSGGGQPSKRDIHMRSAQSRWLSVPWIEPQKAPCSRLRSSSVRRAAAS